MDKIPPSVKEGAKFVGLGLLTIGLAGLILNSFGDKPVLKDIKAGLTK